MLLLESQKYCIIPSLGDLQNIQIHRVKEDGGCQRQVERENGKLLMNGCKVSVKVNE